MSQYLLFCRPPSPPHFFPSPHVCHATNGENVRAICIYSGIPEVRGRESESGLLSIRAQLLCILQRDRRRSRKPCPPLRLCPGDGRLALAPPSLIVDDDKAVKLPSHSIVGRGSLPCMYPVSIHFWVSLASLAAGRPNQPLHRNARSDARLPEAGKQRRPKGKANGATE